jgi:nucleoside-diphosphate-sugar epimerase
MKILVTGANGFIGSHLVDRFLDYGHEITVISRKNSNSRWLKDLPIRNVEASYDDLKSLEIACKDVDYIYHSAGLVAAKNYDEFLKANKFAVENLLTASLNSTNNIKRFVLVSSQTVAGPSKSLNEPAREEDEPNPITSYGKSKKAGEDVAREFMSKLPVTIVRPPAVYGPRDTAIKDIFKLAKKGIGTLIGFNQKSVSLIHVNDLVRGIQLAGEADISAGETYFITSKEFYDWENIFEVMKKTFNKKMFLKVRIPHPLVLSIAYISDFFGKFSKNPPVFDYEKGIDFIQQYWICSPEKAKKDLGFISEISLEDGFRSTADWYIQNKWI